jgi:hypothetical protein
LALDRNIDHFLGNVWYNTGRLNIIDYETRFTGTCPDVLQRETRYDCENIDFFDNIHTANEGQTVFVPGCRGTDPVIGWFGSFEPFDCNHMYWRWSGSGTFETEAVGDIWLNPLPNVDPMVEPATDGDIQEVLRGQPYLAPGQKIEIAILEAKTGEEDPDDPFSLIDPRGTQEGLISVSTPCYWLRGESAENCVLGSADPVRVWYVAESKNKNYDTFFRHGSFALDLKGAPLRALFSTFSFQDEPDVEQHMKKAANEVFWSANGRLLAPVNGENVFVELSNAAQLIQDTGTGKFNTDVATSAILFSAQTLVLDTMDAATGSIKGAFLSSSPTHVLANLETRAETSPTVPSSDNSTTESEIIKILSSNKELTLALEYYKAALNETDLSKATQIIDNFRQSWLHTIKGMGEVMTVLGLTPPIGIGANVTSTSTIPDGGFLIYENSEYGFKIRYPADWNAEKGVGLYPNSRYIDVVRFSPSDSEYESVAVILDPDRVTTIPDLLRDSTNEYYNHDTLKNAKVIESSTDSILAGNQAYELVFTASDNITEYKNKEVGTSVGGKAYYISYFSDPANYDKYLPLAERMFDSFELTSTVTKTTPTDNQTTTPSPPPSVPAVTDNGTVLISDDFNSENNGSGMINYQSFKNWIVKDGSVDLIGNGFYDMPGGGGNGLYVDLDGTTSDVGILGYSSQLKTR